MTKKDLKKEAEDFFGQPRRGSQENQSGAPAPDQNVKIRQIQPRDQGARPSAAGAGGERLTRPNGLSQSLADIMKVI